MIAIEADFNHLNGTGQLILADLAVHASTPFARIAESDDRILFIDGNEFVEGRVVADDDHGWVGSVDWGTQGTLTTYPANRPVITTAVA